VKKYLIDVNLPYYFSIWNKPEYIHQKDIDDDWSDDKIWKYAKENILTIVSKDSDFSNRIMLKEPPPKVIHIRIGNMKIKEFFQVIDNVWSEVILLSEKQKLVNVFIDRIEGIN
jgi:predicted nuclease of predicted toxin-antitoxin system